MRECETLQDDLKAYWDGELSPMARMAIRLHLIRCASCRKELQIMEQIGNELRAGDTGGMDATLRAKLIAGIPEPSSEAPTAPKPLPRWKRRPVILWGAAATAALLGFLYQATPHLVNGSLPSFSTAESNSKQLGIASSQYSQDYDEKYATASPGGTAVAASAPMRQQVDIIKMNRMSRHRVAAAKVEQPHAVLNEDAAGATSVPATPPMPAPKSVQMQSAIAAPTRQVHREATISVEVAKLEESSDAVEAMVKETGGYVASNQLSTGDDDTKSASLTTKVPVTQFDSFLARVAKLGNILAKSVNGEDITERVSDQAHEKRSLRDQIEDAEARLKAARNHAERRDEAENIRDLKVQAAQAEGRLELLNKMAALATVTVELHEKPKPPVVKTSGFMDDINATTHAAMDAFLQAARLPFLMLIWIIAYAPVWLVLALAYRYVVRT